MTWKEKISQWKSLYEVKTLNPVSLEKIQTVLEELNLELPVLREFYGISNGLMLEWFKILPIENPDDIKRTWDSVTRANDPEHSRFGVDEQFLARFFVFADMGGNTCAAIDRQDGTIWYEENDELQQTDLSLADFIELSLKETQE